MTKMCNKCNQPKEMNVDNFYKRKTSKDGYRNECKECIKEHRRKYRKDNEAHVKEVRRMWSGENREHLASYSKDYYSKNREHCLGYEFNYRQRNKEMLATKDRIYYEENKERISQVKKEYYNDNPHIYSKARHTRRSKLKEQVNDLTESQYNKTLDYFNNSCSYCGMSNDEHLETFNQKLHQDHIVPVNDNGGFTKGNIIPSCKTCNSSKNAKSFKKWYKTYKHFNEGRYDNILSFISNTSNEAL